MALAPPRIYTCADWGARPVATRFAAAVARGIVTHHTAGPNVVPKTDADEEIRRCFALARAIQRDHQNRKPKGWVDSGHHFLLTRGGIILEGRHGTLAAAKRGRCVRGAHASATLPNSAYFGIEWEGCNDQAFMVTPVQWAMGVQLCAWLSLWGKFDTAENLPHRYFKPTACPGTLADRLPELRREAHDLKVKILAEAA